ncbi:MAG TPA: hypothetical protein VF519_05295 [Mycobacteriales bacterium]|jgi:hypothetical protein
MAPRKKNDEPGTAGFEPAPPAAATPPPPPPPPPGYAPPAYPPPAPAPDAAGWGSPQGWNQPPPRRSRAVGIGTVVKGGIAVVFAVGAISGGVSAIRRDIADPFSRPNQIGTAQLLLDENSQKIAKDALDGTENIHRGVSGLYGVKGKPTMLLLAGDADDEDASSVFRTFAKESKEDGYTVGKPVNVGNVLCASVSGYDIPAVVCVWGGKKSDGVLLHLGERNGQRAGKLTAEAQAKVEA